MAKVSSLVSASSRPARPLPEPALPEPALPEPALPEPALPVQTLTEDFEDFADAYEDGIEDEEDEEDVEYADPAVLDPNLTIRPFPNPPLPPRHVRLEILIRRLIVDGFQYTDTQRKLFLVALEVILHNRGIEAAAQFTKGVYMDPSLLHSLWTLPGTDVLVTDLLTRFTTAACSESTFPYDRRAAAFITQVVELACGPPFYECSYEHPGSQRCRSIFRHCIRNMNRGASIWLFTQTNIAVTMMRPLFEEMLARWAVDHVLSSPSLMHDVAVEFYYQSRGGRRVSLVDVITYIDKLLPGFLPFYRNWVLGFSNQKTALLL